MSTTKRRIPLVQSTTNRERVATIALLLEKVALLSKEAKKDRSDGIARVAEKLNDLIVLEAMPLCDRLQSRIDERLAIALKKNLP